jgi:hypothetical protein
MHYAPTELFAQNVKGTENVKGTGVNPYFIGARKPRKIIRLRYLWFPKIIRLRYLWFNASIFRN